MWFAPENKYLCHHPKELIGVCIWLLQPSGPNGRRGKTEDTTHSILKGPQNSNAFFGMNVFLNQNAECILIVREYSMSIGECTVHEGLEHRIHSFIFPTTLRQRPCSSMALPLSRCLNLSRKSQLSGSKGTKWSARTWNKPQMKVRVQLLILTLLGSDKTISWASCLKWSENNWCEKRGGKSMHRAVIVPLPRPYALARRHSEVTMRARLAVHEWLGWSLFSKTCGRHVLWALL